jgi:Flp pilus assembly pilin Flp
MLALMIMAMMIAITSLGTKVSNMYTSVTEASW